jgi:hypothetical protein
MTRALFFNTAPDQRFAIDAEMLHRNPELLNAFSPHSYARFRVLDTAAYMACLVGVLASLSIAWWMFVPGVVVCVMMLATNQKAAADTARKAARRSVDAFRDLHELGVLWLMPVELSPVRSS